jgi:hypothetical protein
MGLKAVGFEPCVPNAVPHYSANARKIRDVNDPNLTSDR